MSQQQVKFSCWFGDARPGQYYKVIGPMGRDCVTVSCKGRPLVVPKCLIDTREDKLENFNTIVNGEDEEYDDDE